MNKDIASGALLLVLAAGYYWATLQIPSSSLSDDVGAHGMPTVLAAALAVIAALILGRAVVSKLRVSLAHGRPANPMRAVPAKVPAEADDGDEDERYEATLPRALGLIAIGVLYIVVALLAGYIPALAVLILVTALYEGMPFGWQPAAVAIGGAVCFWLLFVKLLGTEQPFGLLKGLI